MNRKIVSGEKQSVIEINYGVGRNGTWRKLSCSGQYSSARENSIVRESADLARLIESCYMWGRYETSCLPESRCKLRCNTFRTKIVITDSSWKGVSAKRTTAKGTATKRTSKLARRVAELFAQSVGHWSCHSCVGRRKKTRINGFYVSNLIHS